MSNQKPQKQIHLGIDQNSNLSERTMKRTRQNRGTVISPEDISPKFHITI